MFLLTNLEEGIEAVTESTTEVVDTIFSTELWITIGLFILQFFFVIIIAAISIKVLNYFSIRFIKKTRYFEGSKELTLINVTKATIKVIVYFTAIITILKMFGIGIETLIATAGIASLAVGFAAQNLVRDFITGLFILLENQYNIGDLVVLRDQKGVVENITMRVTQIRSFDGSLHFIPNGEIAIVTNLNKEYSRAIISVGVDYNADIDFVMEILDDEMKKAPKYIEELLIEPEVLGIDELADNSVNIKIAADCAAGSAIAVERKLRLIVKKRLDKEEVSIPFPQRVVHIVSPE